MTRKTFDQELKSLQDDMLALGQMVEEALTNSTEILKKQDLAGAQKIKEADLIINQKRFAMEEKVLVLIATQQPLAIDLRILAAVLEITSELERIGDYAKGIAKITLLIGQNPLLKPLIDLPLMAQKARAMLHRALEAFVEQDVEMARAIPADDNEVDQLYNQIYRELITYIMADPSAIEQANYLLWAAHNLERAADRVINLCERVVFTVTGELEELN